MPFCRECSGQVDETWKFCPHCNSSLQTASVNVLDGVIAGDVTVSKNITNISNRELECPQCKAMGNITLHPCQYTIYSDKEGCLKKICNLCRDSSNEHSIFCNYCRHMHVMGLEMQQKEIERLEQERRDESRRLLRIGPADPLTPEEREAENARRKSEQWTEFWQALYGLTVFFALIFGWIWWGLTRPFG